MATLPWFLTDHLRLAQERTEIERLSDSTDWLVGCDWQFSGSDLCLDAVILAHEHEYAVRLRYPSMFPDIPAIVLPRDADVRWSAHQYGSDGPLCLEWGPDTWHSGVTGAMLLESAHKLLQLENPLGTNASSTSFPVPSRHFLTPGQELRGQVFRWYESGLVRESVKVAPVGSIGQVRFSSRQIGKAFIFLIHACGTLEGDLAPDASVPSGLLGGEVVPLHGGLWFKTELQAKALNACRSFTELRSILEPWGSHKVLDSEGASPINGVRSGYIGILIADADGNLHFLVTLSTGNLVFCSTVCSEELASNNRVPAIEQLRQKSVAIVGLGSAGSKMATSLARMGVRKFVLCDQDILLPENLGRHALDWQGVALHKAEAMEAAIKNIAPDAQLETSCLHLTGQESNAALNGICRKLTACDLIVDATADRRVFNLLAAVSRRAEKPVVWLEVYAGGIGGMIARSRPDVEADPRSVLASYLKYCEDNPTREIQAPAENYSMETEDGNVLSASDADVAIIAHHAARFVVDSLLPKEQTEYPYPIYLIGLRRGWIFQAPFDTIPIQAAIMDQVAGKPFITEAEEAESLAFIQNLLKKNEDEAADTA